MLPNFLYSVFPAATNMLQFDFFQSQSPLSFHGITNTAHRCVLHAGACFFAAFCLFWSTHIPLLSLLFRATMLFAPRVKPYHPFTDNANICSTLAPSAPCVCLVWHAIKCYTQTHHLFNLPSSVNHAAFGKHTHCLHNTKAYALHKHHGMLNTPTHPSSNTHVPCVGTHPSTLRAAPPDLPPHCAHSQQGVCTHGSTSPTLGAGGLPLPPPLQCPPPSSPPGGCVNGWIQGVCERVDTGGA